MFKGLRKTVGSHTGSAGPSPGGSRLNGMDEGRGVSTSAASAGTGKHAGPDPGSGILSASSTISAAANLGGFGFGGGDAGSHPPSQQLQPPSAYHNQPEFDEFAFDDDLDDAALVASALAADMTSVEQMSHNHQQKSHNVQTVANALPKRGGLFGGRLAASKPTKPLHPTTIQSSSTISDYPSGAILDKQPAPPLLENSNQPPATHLSASGSHISSNTSQTNTSQQRINSRVSFRPHTHTGPQPNMITPTNQPTTQGRSLHTPLQQNQLHVQQQNSSSINSAIFPAKNSKNSLLEKAQQVTIEKNHTDQHHQQQSETAQARMNNVSHMQSIMEGASVNPRQVHSQRSVASSQPSNFFQQPRRQENMNFAASKNRYGQAKQENVTAPPTNLPQPPLVGIPSQAQLHQIQDASAFLPPSRNARNASEPEVGPLKRTSQPQGSVPRPSLLRFQAPLFPPPSKPAERLNNPRILTPPPPPPPPPISKSSESAATVVPSCKRTNSHQNQSNYPGKHLARHQGTLQLSQEEQPSYDDDDPLFSDGAGLDDRAMIAAAAAVELDALAARIVPKRSSLASIDCDLQVEGAGTIGKRPGKRLPGPAGELPDQLSPASLLAESSSHRNSMALDGGPRLISDAAKKRPCIIGGDSKTPSDRRRSGGSSDATDPCIRSTADFRMVAWLTMKRFVADYENYTNTSHLTPALLASCKNKVSDLVVLVKEIKATDNDASAVFADPMGEVRGTVHAGVFDMFNTEGAVGPAGDVVSVGSVVHLKNVSVFFLGASNDGDAFLNVTRRNVHAVFTAAGIACGRVEETQNGS
ncbi:hypothetical protein BC830DRAFT_1092513 [Chytriomyces sp. MP71]|nr:hypothetical protein BC830DRAFT_1092513 [Chytriomyces sp. MP71]